jgi:signal transduction histidine kinase/putative methionine-R-sulfoxide reductase with GAF domain
MSHFAEDAIMTRTDRRMMAATANHWVTQLKEACKLAEARWAIWLTRSQDGWRFNAHHALTKRRLAALSQFIQDQQVVVWLSGALSGGRTRSRDAGRFAAALGCRRVYAFPNPAGHSVLLVGANQLDRSAEGVFRLLALDLSPKAASEPPKSADTEPVERGLRFQEIEPSYDPQGGLASILEYLAKRVPCDAACLTVRSGDIFRVQALWNCPPNLQGHDISIQSDPALARMVETRQGIILNDAVRVPEYIALAFDPPMRSWLGAPILVGQRVIGYVAFSATRPGAFEPADLTVATRQVGRMAYQVENAIVFSEAARYLQRLAMLNELATATALGLDTDEAARRVVQHLRRAFGTERVFIFLLSPDGKALREYGREALKEPPWIASDDSSLVGYTVESGLPARVGDVHDALRPFTFDPDVRSALAVPLKYRGKIVGALALESLENNAFSTQDEQLLVVIASHLAGLIENVRLNEETRERARKLQDSVRQLQAVRETALDITGALDLDTLLRRVVLRARELVDARGAELGLVEDNGQAVRVVISETPWYDNIGLVMPLMAGVAGRVAAFGEPVVVADYNAWSGRLLPDRQAPFRAVAGVPLKFTDPASGKVAVIGTLTVLDDRLDKEFRQEDLQLLELLAPQVAVSIRNARLYQELQERIEAQRLAESRLLRSARLAAVGEMAAGVAHELNNPLTTVAGFAELVLEDLPSGALEREDLELVLREAQRARGVVRRLLDFSRPVENLRVRTDLNDLVGDVLALVNHQARSFGIEIIIELWDQLPWLLVDPNQIKQVLLNLIHNAIQAMPGGGRLTLETRPAQREGRHWLVVAIQDTGEGISPENQERIFEPFFTTRAGTGTGLGLSISYTIVTDHGGFIEVDSEMGRGSCFSVYLPIDEAQHSEFSPTLEGGA